MNIGAAGLKLIAEFEGFSPVPYNDPVGHCTVGYGELLHLGNCTLAELARPAITQEQGRQRLAVKVVPYADAVARSLAGVELNQNQFDALTSLCYNIGQGGFANSGVRRAVATGGDVCAALNRIVTGTDGVVYPGLVRRRKAECVLYHMPYEEEEPEMKVADWWTRRVLPANGAGWQGEINLAVDFGIAKAYDLRVLLDTDPQYDGGSIIFSHGQLPITGAGGANTPLGRASAFLLVPGRFGTAKVEVKGRVRVLYLACAGMIE